MSRPSTAGRTLSALAATALVLSGASAAHADTAQRPSTAGTVKPAPARTDPQLQSELTARARARATGKPVQVASMTTAYSTTTANRNGSFTTVTSTKPARVRTGNGGWTTLDATLRKNPDGRIAMTAAQSSLELSPGGDGPLVSVSDGSGHAMALTLPFTLPAPVLKGDTATYRNVSPGLDLVVTAQTDGGFREVFVVHDAAAARKAASLTFATTLKGLTVKQDAAGNLSAVDSRTGALFMSAPAPAVWDSSTTGRPDADTPEAGPPAETAGADGPGPRSNTAKLPVSVTSGRITLNSGSAHLGGPRIFPEFIDPSWSLPTTLGTMMNYSEVQGYSGCQSYNNYDSSGLEPGVGNVTTNSSCPGAYRSFYQDSLGGLSSTDIVTNSVINISEVYSSLDSCGVAEPIAVDWTGTIPNPSGWNKQPGVISNVSNNTVYTDGGGKCGAYGYSFPVTGAIAQLAAGNNTNWTWGLFGNESTENTLVRFNDNPTITTTFDIRPAVPTNPAASPAPVTATGTAQPCSGTSTAYLTTSNIGGSDVATLSATLTSAVASAQMQGDFTLTDVTSGSVYQLTSNGYVTSGASVSVQTPALVNGNKYTWSVVANDGYYSSAATSPVCAFTADQSPPTNPAFTSTDFPPSGSGTTTTTRFGQAGNNSGVLTLSSSDSGPGLNGFYYSIGSPVPANGGTFLAAANGSANLTVTPSNWGTTTVYAQAVDVAGVRSAANSYSFYLPWSPGAKVTPGDINGDGIPDLLTTNSSGNLLLYAGDSDPAAVPAVLSTPVDSPDGQSTPWNKYLVTHRGSFSNQSVDDVWAYDTVNNNLYLYRNTGSSAFQNTANVVNVTKAGVDLDSGGAGTGCTVTSTADCSGYDDTDWKNLTQVVAVGDFYAGSSLDTSPAGNDIVTVEGDALWLYQGKNGPDYLAYPIKIGTSGWSGVTLMGPGTIGGHPALWARNNSTGVVTQYLIALDSAGYPESLGAAGSSGTTIGTGFTAAAYPTVISPGDLQGNGNPDLLATDPSGNLWFFASSSVTGGGVAPTHQWLLNEGTGSTIHDSAGSLSGTVSSTGATWAGGNGRPALSFDGNSGYAETNGNAVNTGGSYTVSAWVDMTSIPAAGSNYTAVSEFGTNNSPFYLQYNGGSWAFVISNNDTTSPTLNGPNGPYNVAANTWYHITGVYNSSTQTAQIYVNDSLVGTTSGLPSWSAAGDLDIGRDLYTGLQVDYFPGQISDVETWNTALTSAQVGGLDSTTSGIAGTGTLVGPLNTV